MIHDVQNKGNFHNQPISIQILDLKTSKTRCFDSSHDDI